MFTCGSTNVFLINAVMCFSDIYYLFLFFFFFFKQKTAYEMQRGLVGSEMCIRDSNYLESTMKKTTTTIIVHTQIAQNAHYNYSHYPQSFRSYYRFTISSRTKFYFLRPIFQISRLVFYVRQFLIFLHHLQHTAFDAILNSSYIPVSYTHLTLPTILLVQISVVAVSLKKKQKKYTSKDTRQNKIH
eukprot:TRINITY_DN6428_c0_g1_i1.p1 TRINITY_DN6428_c0_g1~~TRINITY_DN6428_c0_g1_i1.p1  ORF type:complete len:186 (-),score=20.05 TRINITY_DN6428_c0_g1_i1:63-620(-)